MTGDLPPSESRQPLTGRLEYWGLLGEAPSVIKAEVPVIFFIVLVIPCGPLFQVAYSVSGL